MSLVQTQIYQGNTLKFPKMPKLEKPALYLGAHGEVFDYVTLSKEGLTFTMSEVNIPPGKGPPAHMHHFVAEWFFAPEGGITLFSTDIDYLDLNNPPSKENGTQVTVYLVPLAPGQVFCSPVHRVHGYVNSDRVDRPLTCIWKPYEGAPDMMPYKDGGTREFFEGVHAKIEDMNNLPSVSEKRRSHYIAQSHSFGIPHSSYLLEFVNRVEPYVPDTLQHRENFEELYEMLDMVNECNSGNKKIFAQ